MKILISAGGTGGHINPAIAIGKYILKNDPHSEILYIGSKGNLEKSLYEKSGLDFKLFEAKGLSRKSIHKNIGILIKAYKAYREIEKEIEIFKPDIGIGAGGYISAIAMTALKNKKIPFIIHEQNAYPGLTTRYLSKYAKKYALAFLNAKKYLKYEKRAVLTGNPIQKEFLNTSKAAAREKLGFLPNEKIVLCFGGSLGAEKLNEIFVQLAEKVSKENNFTIIIATGFSYYDEFMAKIKEKNINIKSKIIIRSYIDNMADMLIACDLAITRSGAMTISEIAAIKKPSILVPSPNVTEDHQTKNAMVLGSVGGATVISEKTLEFDLIYKEINSIINNKEKIATMQNALEKIAITDGDKRIYNIINDVYDINCYHK
jgi:UDP-N-acetylglucosamine--N-acetylmuramyl-(pentapeptide) pyrophosphoryl-undecaprenol N-acetylglucosamine transferase